MNTTVAVKEATALSETFLADLAKEAKEAAAKERPAVGRIGLKSGQLTYQGQPMKDNKMEVLILAAGFRNVYYMGKYNPDNVVPPNCFAVSLTGENMAPHANVVEPEHTDCDTCPMHEWGSADTGRGKACKETRRLVLMPGSAVTDDPEVLKSAELAVLDLPVTSTKEYANYVNTLAATANVPPYAAIAEIHVVPDAKTQFKVKLHPLRIVPSQEHLLALRTRLEMADRLCIEPYTETSTREEIEAAAAAAAPKGKAGSKAKF